MNKQILFLLKNIISETNFFNFMEKINEEDFFNLREDESFESEWLENFNDLKKVKLDDDLVEIINQIREISFKNTFLYTQNPEISSYISDDFELISKSLLLNEDNWILKHLWKAYQNQKIYIN
ncbi:hypothetical protein [Avibacterium paragallinarum]|uniref:hypothetical protein n=1 Tax=Avibacterium paragallinarum TaxID=728 RepID=UPI002EDA0666